MILHISVWILQKTYKFLKNLAKSCKQIYFKILQNKESPRIMEDLYLDLCALPLYKDF